MSKGIPGDSYCFALTAIITVFYQLFFFFIAAYFKFDKVTDLAGGSNFVILAVVSFAVECSSDPSSRQATITAIVIFWGLRLSSFLFYRILMISEDHRFDEMRGNPLKFLAFWIFQMLWVWEVCLPMVFLNSIEDHRKINAGDVVGFVLSIMGIIIEASADQTKFNFK